MYIYIFFHVLLNHSYMHKTCQICYLMSNSRCYKVINVLNFINELKIICLRAEWFYLKYAHSHFSFIQKLIFRLLSIPKYHMIKFLIFLVLLNEFPIGLQTFYTFFTTNYLADGGFWKCDVSLNLSSNEYFQRYINTYTKDIKENIHKNGFMKIKIKYNLRCNIYYNYLIFTTHLYC